MVAERQHRIGADGRKKVGYVRPCVGSQGNGRGSDKSWDNDTFYGAHFCCLSSVFMWWADITRMVALSEPSTNRLVAKEPSTGFGGQPARRVTRR
jgi:hypothetical protein